MFAIDKKVIYISHLKATNEIQIMIQLAYYKLNLDVSLNVFVKTSFSN